jgi:hypothetical protein
LKVHKKPTSTYNNKICRKLTLHKENNKENIFMERKKEKEKIVLFFIANN